MKQIRKNGWLILTAILLSTVTLGGAILTPRAIAGRNQAKDLALTALTTLGLSLTSVNYAKLQGAVPHQIIRWDFTTNAAGFAGGISDLPITGHLRAVNVLLEEALENTPTIFAVSAYYTEAQDLSAAPDYFNLVTSENHPDLLTPFDTEMDDDLVTGAVAGCYNFLLPIPVTYYPAPIMDEYIILGVYNLGASKTGTVILGFE